MAEPRTALIVGAGQIGTAVARALAARGWEIHLHARRRASVREAAAEVGVPADRCTFGDVLLPPDAVETLEGNVVAAAACGAGARLEALVRRVGPCVVVDAVTTVAMLAGRARPEAAMSGLAGPDARAGGVADVLGEAVASLQEQTVAIERLLTTGEVQRYVKVSTTGLGGMGLDIPFTHGDAGSVLSPALWLKVALAGVQSHLLWALARGHAGRVALVVPRAFVGFESLAGIARDPASAPPTVGAGDDRRYSADEIACFGADHQMGVITADEVAEEVAALVEGDGTGSDLLAALQGAALAPTARGSRSRDRVVAAVRTRGEAPVTTGSLGPRTARALIRLAALRGSIAGPLAGFGAHDQPGELPRGVAERLAADAAAAGLELTERCDEDAVCVCATCAWELLAWVRARYDELAEGATGGRRQALRDAFESPDWQCGEVLSFLWSAPGGDGGPD